MQGWFCWGRGNEPQNRHKWEENEIFERASKAMLNLPAHEHLNTAKLAAVFNNTTATYKFYWLLSIVQELEKDRIVLPKQRLFAGMLANAWYTVNYFRVSFGIHDKIQEAIQAAQKIEDIPNHKSLDSITELLYYSKQVQTKRLLKHFDANVPHWFLSPWAAIKDKKHIYQLSQSPYWDGPYMLRKDSIEVNEVWAEYLLDNARIIKDFVYWNLALFLQKRNPNVPDIPNKLIKPPSRASLSKQRSKFWIPVLKQHSNLECIYTGKKLQIDSFHMEHFVPHSFVSHDLIWNLIPSDPNINIVKNNKLPNPEIYLDKFCRLQRIGFETVKIQNSKNKMLEDYLTIFPDLNEPFSEKKLKEAVKPLISIASNNGFEYMT